MKTITILMLLIALPAHGALIDYKYEFSGLTLYGEGAFTIDTTKRVTTNLTFQEHAEGYSFEWQGALPFREFSRHIYGSWIEGSLGRISSGPFELSTNLWVTRGPNSGDPFMYLEDHAGADDEWALWINGELSHSFPVRIFDKQVHPVPEPATLSLLFLGLAAIGIRRRLVSQTPH